MVPIIRLTQEVTVHEGTGVNKGNSLPVGTLMRKTASSSKDKLYYTEQPDGFGYSRLIPESAYSVVNPFEAQSEDFDWLFRAMCKGVFPIPHFEPVYSDDPVGMAALISSIASGGSSKATDVSHVLLPEKSVEGPFVRNTRWARLFPWYTQAGKMDGRGYILLYDVSYGKKRVPIGGRYSLCNHEYVDRSTPERKMRGDHRGHCAKCGLNMSVDSSD